MPIYQYLCNGCGYQAEYLVSKVGEIPAGCKECSNADLLRVLQGQIFGIGRSHKSSSERNTQENVNASSLPIEVMIELPAVVIQTVGDKVVGLGVITSKPEKNYKDLN